MIKPLLSIITINRNNAAGLRKTMQSVFNLTFKDYEYIIIDGASTDNSVEVIKEFLAIPEYAEKITYWVSEPDKGIYNAMNKGLEHVNGTLVNMMNSGDCFIDDSLDKLHLWEKENKDTVLYGAVSKWRDEIFIECDSPSPNDLDHTSLNHQATFVPLSIHKQNGNYDESLKMVADYEFWCRLKSKNVPFFWINQIICNFDLTGISSVPNEKRLAEKEKVQKKYGYYIKPSLYFRTKQFIKKMIRK